MIPAGDLYRTWDDLLDQFAWDDLLDQIKEVNCFQEQNLAALRKQQDHGVCSEIPTRHPRT
jgi:hypothetical protein